MTDDQKAIALLLVLGAGVTVLLLRSNGNGGGAAYAAPVSTTPCLPCARKAQNAMLVQPVARAGSATRYGNEETTEIVRDGKGRVVKIIQHRDATVAAA